MNIIQRFIPEKFTDTRPGLKLVPKYITIHETDNKGFKANAEAHARLQENGNSRQASWHLQVDDTYCIQSIPFNEVAWAAGDRNGPGNRSSIHLEICVNSDGDYHKAVMNAAEVVAQLMKQFNIPISNVVQHNHWSGKNCPSIMRSGKAGITWDDLIAQIKEFSTLKPSVKAVQTSASWTDLKKGQIGRITILKPINLWKRVGDKLEMVRVLQPGEKCRVYNYDDKHGGQYSVGAGEYITNMDGYIKYETPSKAMLEKVNK